MRRRSARPSPLGDEIVGDQKQPTIAEDDNGREQRPRLGELLLRHKLLKQRQLAEALLQQSASGKRLGMLLVELGLIDERDLARVLSEQLAVPLADLRRQQPQNEALEAIPERLARTANALPIRIDDEGSLEVALADPVDATVLEELRRASARPLRVLIAPPGDILRTIENSYRAIAHVKQHVEAFERAIDVQREIEQTLKTGTTEDAPVVQVVNLVVMQALRDRASDVHIEPQDGRIRIRYRIDGALHDVIALPISMAQAIVSRIKIMAGMNIVERQRPQDGQIAMNLDGRAVDIRVSTVATIWGEKAVLRLLDKSRSLLRLNELGMPTDTHARYSSLIRSPFGMVICAGPTGSGKTTTLYASINEINETERNITTIEDPVEYIFPSINQIQIREQAGLTFATGLRSILRQDPDVILVGEIRDVETARIAVQSALTGHLVLSSLHATDSATALHRFVDMGIEPFLVASSILAVVGQRLVRTVCGACKVSHQPTADELAFYVASGGEKKTRFWRGEGCNLCSGTGYQGRVGVYEVMPVTDALKQLILKEASHERIRQQAQQEGMRTLREQSLALVASDVTTISEVLRAIYTV